MKILITPNTNIIVANEVAAQQWNVDRIVTHDSVIRSNGISLPFKVEDNEVTVMVPTVFDAVNALSYDGVDLALRILFKTIYERNRGINIVLLGCETLDSFLLHYPYPNIMKIPGISYYEFNIKTIANIRLTQCQITYREEYLKYIDDLGIHLPASFKSTHSLTNEWCLYKWNSFMEFNEDVDENKLNNLYFDYIKAIGKINNEKYPKISNNEQLQKNLKRLLDRDGKILLIDDKPSWHKFFENLFTKSKIKFRAIGSDFIKKTVDEVKEQIRMEVESFCPDVILLDFRLIEDRDAKEKIDNISGTLVLKDLKGIFNVPGIAFGRQVIIFTATSRIENILLLKAGNADGFILKEKPEMYKGKEITKNAISKMVYTLNTAIERAEFLIPLNEKLKELSSIELDIKSELRDTIQAVSESVRLITQNNDINEGVLKLAYLNLFSILEYVKPSKREKIDNYIQHTAPNDILKDWNNIDEVRNSLAHGDKEVKIDNRKQDLSLCMIKEWTLKLCNFINGYIKHNYSQS
ncbi:MAG: hypothetical protein PUD64_10155 [Bacteroidales bacterium]|nr:hypothetical protein [Bacteroidales bacterium]